MSRDWVEGGVDAVCPSCGKEFHVLRPWCYAYRLNVSVETNKQRMLYFDKYTCKHKYEQEYEELKRNRRSEAAYKRHLKKRGKLK